MRFAQDIGLSMSWTNFQSRRSLWALTLRVLPLFLPHRSPTDLSRSTHLFIPAESRPANLELVTQNLIEPFPTAWNESFDLVHQRFILPLFKEAELDTVINSLVATLKPGGWIQFVEPNFSEPVSEPADQTKAFRMIHELTRVTMADHAPGLKIAPRLEKAGLTNVKHESIDMIVGLQHPDRELGERSLRNYKEVIGYYHSVNKCVMSMKKDPVPIANFYHRPETFNMSAEEWEKLPENFEKDMTNHKTAIRHSIVWAQKPY